MYRGEYRLEPRARFGQSPDIFSMTINIYRYFSHLGGLNLKFFYLGFILNSRVTSGRVKDHQVGLLEDEVVDVERSSCSLAILYCEVLICINIIVS